MCVLSDAPITTPQPLLPLFLELPFHKPYTAFHVSESLLLSPILFLSFCPQIGPVISFLIVLPGNVLHVVVNLRYGIRDLPYRILAIDPLTAALSALLHACG